MTSEEFRRAGYEVVDWIAGYLENIRDYPVFPRMKPGDLMDRLPACAPEQGEPAAALLQDFRELIVPAVTHWNHPRFLAYFSITGSPPGILAEMLTAALNVNGMLWKTCPALTELEQVVLGWLRQWIGLPEEFFGIIYDTASVSTLHAIAAAREAADPEAREQGARPGLVLYTSEQAHSSVEKGAIALGIGQANVRKIAVDERFRMRPEALEAAILDDLAQGRKPFCVVATTGTTSTTSVDPVPAIADIAERHGLWLHIDAAYGGAAAVIPEFSWVLEGAGRADSLVMNPHKWLFTPVDFSAFYTRRPEILRRAFTLVPAYLRSAPDPRATNYMDYGVQLGRRFRALKLWFVMRHYGREGVVAALRGHIALAQELAGWIQADPRFELAAPTPFSVVCFRYRGSDEDNLKLIEAVNATGVALLSSTVLNGRTVVRLAIGNLKVTRGDIELVWECLSREAGRLTEPPPES